MSSPIFKVRQVAWRNLTTALRTEGIIPNIKIVEQKSKQAISAASLSEGVNLRPSELVVMREKLTASIMKRWDASKARSVPKKARDQRRTEGRQIALGAAAPISRRRLATESGSSKSRVQRTLVESGLAQPWRNKPLSPFAAYLVEVIAYNVPPESRRAVSSADLCRLGDIPPHRFTEILDEINGAKIGFHVLSTTVRTDAGPYWVVATRGRRSTPEKNEAWLRRCELKRLQKNKLRPDQRHYAIALVAPALGLTEGDIYAVTDVVQKTSNILQWKRFIEVTSHCLAEAEDRVDLDSIVSVVRSAMKLNEAKIYDEGMMSLAASWVKDAATRKLAQSIMLLANDLFELGERRSLETVVRKWAERVDYLGNINRGRLPGRSIERATFLLDRDELLDEDILQNPPALADG